MDAELEPIRKELFDFADATKMTSDEAYALMQIIENGRINGKVTTTMDDPEIGDLIFHYACLRNSNFYAEYLAYEGPVEPFWFAIWGVKLPGKVLAYIYDAKVGDTDEDNIELMWLKDWLHTIAVRRTMTEIQDFYRVNATEE